MCEPSTAVTATIPARRSGCWWSRRRKLVEKPLYIPRLDFAVKPWIPPLWNANRQSRLTNTTGGRKNYITPYKNSCGCFFVFFFFFCPTYIIFFVFPLHILLGSGSLFFFFNDNWWCQWFYGRKYRDNIRFILFPIFFHMHEKLPLLSLITFCTTIISFDFSCE